VLKAHKRGHIGAKDLILAQNRADFGQKFTAINQKSTISQKGLVHILSYIHH
jgi:hypothetical protein